MALYPSDDLYPDDDLYPSEPEPAVIPSPDELRARFRNIGWAELGYAGGTNPDSLEPLISEAVIEFQVLTDGIDLTKSGMNEDKRAPLMRRAIGLLVVYSAMGEQMEVAETAADFDLISSFSAAGYSETRRNAGFAQNQIHPWPVLNRLLHLITFFDTQGKIPSGQPSVNTPGTIPYPGSGIMEPCVSSKFDPPLVGGISRRFFQGP